MPRPQANEPTEPTGAPSGEPSLDDLSPEQRAQAEQLASEMAEVRRQVLSVPASVVIANHAMGLYELAAIHLGAEKPNLDEARSAVDALGAVVETLGDRLGENADTLRDALSQIRLAFVQIKGALEAEDAPGNDTAEA